MTHTNALAMRRRRTARTALLAGLAAVSLGALMGCAPSGPESTGGPSADASNGAGSGTKIMWIGDSVAANEAPALGAALSAAGATFVDESSDGGGVMVDSGGDISLLASMVWDELQPTIEEERPDTIVYQITTYDWGTPEQQQDGYGRLAAEAATVGADLVIVSSPPLVLDDFYEPHAAEMSTTAASAQAVAEASGGDVTFLDASALWGTDPAAEDAQRARDGVHACQQASAEFAVWLTTELEEITGLAPADPEEWAAGDWTAAETYAQFDCPVGGK